MATRKPLGSRSRPTPTPTAKPKVPQKQPTRLENLAAKKPVFDETIDEQLVDHSGVFRVTAAIQQAQTGHADEEKGLRFASDSLVMAAQRDGFPDEPTIDESVEERSIEDEATKVERRARLATLAARARQARTRR